MIQFKDTKGNFWVFTKTNIVSIYRTPRDKNNIAHVVVATTVGGPYSFDIDWNDKECIRES